MRNPMRVLVAENELPRQKEITDILDRLQYDYVVYARGEDVLPTLQNASFDLYILDHMLDDKLTGYVVAQEIRNAGITAPIVLYSSLDMSEKARLVSAQFIQKDIQLLEQMLQKFPTILDCYTGMDVPSIFLEYTLEVLHAALTPQGLPAALENFSKLESVIAHEKLPQNYFPELPEAKELLNSMIASGCQDPFNDTYIKQLTQVRDMLLETQQSFAVNYVMRSGSGSNDKNS